MNLGLIGIMVSTTDSERLGKKKVCVGKVREGSCKTHLKCVENGGGNCIFIPDMYKWLFFVEREGRP